MASVQKSAKSRLVPVNDRRRRIGEQHPRSVLTDHEVELVHRLREEGLTLAEIARKMEVSKGCVWKIVSGYRRGQVPAGWVRVRDRGEGG
jgi:predicted DNA-binding protein (UPF0251 family)